MRKALLTLGFLALAGATGAQAATIVTSGQAGSGVLFTVNFDGNVNTTNIPGLTSKADFSLVSVVGNIWTFQIDLTVNPSAPITSARVSELGFDLSPDVTAANTSSTGIFTIDETGSFPNTFGPIEHCFKAGGGPNCDGGGGGGVTGTSALAGTGSFTVALDFGAALTSMQFDKFGVRYQSIVGVPCVSAEGCDSGTGLGTVSTVPEPAAWAMMIAAFGLLGWRVRARRYAAA